MRAGSLESALASVELGALPRELENDILEFKQPAASGVRETLTLLADAAVCFANSSGGEIVLGVIDDVSGPAAFQSVPAAYTPDIVRKAIFDRTRPSLTCFVDERMEHGSRLLVIRVPPSVGTCSNTAGLATRRLGSECRPFTPDEQREVLSARGQLDWSAELTDVTVDELDSVEVVRLGQLLRQAGRLDLSAGDSRQTLVDLRLASANGRVTRAGLLLLGMEETLAAKLPEYGYSYQFRPSPGAESVFRLRGRRPLLAAVETLIEAVNSRRQVEPLNLSGGIQLSLADYPIDAVRELIVNALIHRSYETHGTVDIEHSPERLDISSPGGFVAGVSPANILTHPSTPRNRLLTETVAVLQLAERTGQGVDRAYREMLRSGKEPPNFRGEEVRVDVSLAGGPGNKAFIRFVSELPPPLDRDVEILLALTMLRTKRTIDAHVLATVIQRSPAEAQAVLRRLTDQHVIEPTRRTATHPTPTYRLHPQALATMSTAVGYHRRQADASDEKVVEHIREYGFITNRTIQRMFDLDVYRARNLLADMRSRGLIEKIGDARGGPGVRYGLPTD